MNSDYEVTLVKKPQFNAARTFGTNAIQRIGRSATKAPTTNGERFPEIDPLPHTVKREICLFAVYEGEILCRTTPKQTHAPK